MNSPLSENSSHISYNLSSLTETPEPPQKPKRKRPFIATVAIAVAVMISSWGIFTFQQYLDNHWLPMRNTTGNAGWTTNEAVQKWRSIEGIEEVKIRSRDWRANPYKDMFGGTVNNYGTQGIIEIAIRDGYYFNDSKLLLDSAVATLWAVKDLKISAKDPIIVYLKGNTLNPERWEDYGHDKSHSLEDRYEYESNPSPTSSKGMKNPPDSPWIGGAIPLYLNVGRERLGDVPDLSALGDTIQKASLIEDKELIETLYLDRDYKRSSMTGMYCRTVYIDPPLDYFKGMNHFSADDMSIRIDYVFNGNKIATANVPAQRGTTWSSSNDLCIGREYFLLNKAENEVYLEVSTDFKAEYTQEVFAPIDSRIYPVVYDTTRRR